MSAQIQNIFREELILSLLFNDIHIQGKVIGSLDPEFFTEQPRKDLCKHFIQFHNKYNKFPTLQEMVVSLPDGPERDLALKIAGADLSCVDRTLSANMLETFVREEMTKKVLSGIAEDIYERKFDNMQGTIGSLQEAVNFKLDSDLGIDVVDDAEEALERLRKSVVPIPSAIKSINDFTTDDNSTGGGYYRKALSLFIGNSGVGKTFFLCNEAVHAYRTGHNVLYISLEVSEEQIWKRLACNISGIKSTAIKYTDIQEIKSKLGSSTIDGMTQCGRLFVKTMKTTSTTVDADNVRKEIEESQNIKFDMMIIDYIGIIKPAKRHGSYYDPSNSYSVGKEVVEQLRDIALVNNLVLLTASQSNRSGYDQLVKSMANTANSAAINDTADLMITIGNDQMMRQMCMFSHMILKNRFGSAGVDTFFTKINYDTFTIVDANQGDVDTLSAARSQQELDTSNLEIRGEPTVSMPRSASGQAKTQKPKSSKQKKMSENDALDAMQG